MLPFTTRLIMSTYRRPSASTTRPPSCRAISQSIKKQFTLVYMRGLIEIASMASMAGPRAANLVIAHWSVPLFVRTIAIQVVIANFLRNWARFCAPTRSCLQVGLQVDQQARFGIHTGGYAPRKQYRVDNSCLKTPANCTSGRPIRGTSFIFGGIGYPNKK
jgi:hypothetical protein